MTGPKFSSTSLLAGFPVAGALMLLFDPACISARALPPDACSLLTPSQLQQVLGQPFELSDRSLAPPAAPGQPPGRECDYTTHLGASRKVVFIAFVDASADQAREMYDKLTLWLTHKAQLSGIGDAAYVDDNHAIHVLKGTVRYYLNIVPFGEATLARQEQLCDLARLVAAQI
jgi:hypothetical protein